MCCSFDVESFFKCICYQNHIPIYSDTIANTVQSQTANYQILNRSFNFPSCTFHYPFATKTSFQNIYLARTALPNRVQDIHRTLEHPQVAQKMVLRPPLTSLGTHVCCFSLASAAMCRRLLSGKWVPTLLLKDPHTHPQFRVTLWWKTIFHCRTLVATCVLNFPFRNHCFSAFSILFSLLFVFFFIFDIIILLAIHI